MQNKLMKLSVLFVEDNPVLRALSTAILNRRFALIYGAENGKKGLELFKLFRPDIVITDNDMPEMSGIEMTREICKLCGHTPIIISSAAPVRPITNGQVIAEWTRFIQKPLNVTMLFKAIDDLCNHKLAFRTMQKYDWGK